MADYSSWKVNDLKAELKRRGIPQTGLRVKQNFADRLLEDDAKKQAETGGALEETSREPDTEKKEQAERDQSAQQQEPPAQPLESQEPKPEDKPEEKQIPEQTQEEEPVAQRDAAAEDQNESKAGERAQVATHVGRGREQQEPPIETADQQPPQEQHTEPVEEPQAAPEEAAPTGTVDQAAAEPSVPQNKTEPEAPAQAAEQPPVTHGPTHTDTIAPTDKTAPLPPSTSGATTELSTPLPTGEVLDDSRKRKRRSRSPVPTPDTISNKKVRARSESPRVLLPEDTGGEKDLNDTAAAPEPPEAPEEHGRRPSVSEDTRGRKGAPLKQDARFRELFAPVEKEPARPASPPRDAVMEDAEVEPALHAATAALYVGGLMRPLQPAALKSHLTSLASTPGASPNPDVIQDFYLDPIKTHCFASFSSVSAASRTRLALHGTVWPNERNRKTLFVDFIPEHKMQQWINIEEESRGRGGPAPRWEVKYDRTDEGVEAFLEEIDPRASAPQAQAGTPRAPPTGPRASFSHSDRRPSGPSPDESHPQPGQGFQPLDDLFMSTTTKPKLYYLPVSREMADRRLDQFDDLIRKGSFPRRGGDETRRISFEDGDVFVDKGPEFGARARGGGRGRGRGGRGLGGFDRRGRY